MIDGKFLLGASNEIDKISAAVTGLCNAASLLAKEFNNAFGASMHRQFNTFAETVGLQKNIFNNFSGDAAFKSLNANFTQTEKNAAALGKRVSKSVNKIASEPVYISNGLKAMANSLNNIGAEFAGLGLAASQVENLTGKVNNATYASQSFATSLAMIKYNLSTAFQPVVSFVTPALNSFMAGLAKITAYFSAFTHILFGKGIKASSEQTKALNSQGKAYSSAGKAAKDAAKNMSALDELNTLNLNSGTSGGKGTSVSAPVPDTGFDFELNPKILDIFEKIRQSLLNFWAALAPTREELLKLWEVLKVIGGFAWEGLKNFYNSFLLPVGLWALGEGLPNLVRVLREGLEAVNWGLINDAFNCLWTALAPFAINVGEGLLWFYEFVLMPFSLWVLNEAVPVFLQMLAYGIDLLNAVLEVFMPAAEFLWESFLQPIALWTGGIIIEVLELLGKTFNTLTLWISENAPIINECFESLGNTLQAVWENFIEPILNFIWETFKSTFSMIIELLLEVMPYLMAIFNGFCEFLTGVFTGDWDSAFKGLEKIAAGFKDLLIFIISDVIPRIFNSLINWLVSIFTVDWRDAFGGFGAIVNFFSAGMANKLLAIKDMFNGLTEFLAGVFTGNWERAWDGVKGIFTGIWNGIVSTFERAVNLIIDGLNWLFSQMNKIHFEVPDWVPVIGAKSFGFNVNLLEAKSFPRLATGAVIPPQREFLAVLGDQKHGRNLEAPENLIRQIVREESGGASGEMLAPIVIELDGNVLYRAMEKAKKNSGYKTGGNFAYVY